MKKILIIVGLLTLLSCTDNQRSRSWGGTSEMELPKGEKLMMITWKGSDMWYLSRKMTPMDSVENYTFKQHSKWGIIEGEVIIKEKR